MAQCWGVKSNAYVKVPKGVQFVIKPYVKGLSIDVSIPRHCICIRIHGFPIVS